MVTRGSDGGAGVRVVTMLGTAEADRVEKVKT